MHLDRVLHHTSDPLAKTAIRRLSSELTQLRALYESVCKEMDKAIADSDKIYSECEDLKTELRRLRNTSPSTGTA